MARDQVDLTPIERRDELVAWLAQGVRPKAEFRIGTEHEKFAFTRVFEEDATQLDVFHCAEIASLAEGVLAPQGGEGTDAVVATLGVTGSGKVRYMAMVFAFLFV